MVRIKDSRCISEEGEHCKNQSFVIKVNKHRNVFKLLVDYSNLCKTKDAAKNVCYVYEVTRSQYHNNPSLVGISADDSLLFTKNVQLHII